MKARTMAACELGGECRRAGGQRGRHSRLGNPPGRATACLPLRRPPVTEVLAWVAERSMTFRLRQIWSETVVVSADSLQSKRAIGRATIQHSAGWLSCSAASDRWTLTQPTQDSPRRDFASFGLVKEAGVLAHERAKQALPDAHVEARHGHLCVEGRASPDGIGEAQMLGTARQVRPVMCSSHVQQSCAAAATAAAPAHREHAAPDAGEDGASEGHAQHLERRLPEAPRVRLDGGLGGGQGPAPLSAGYIDQQAQAQPCSSQSVSSRIKLSSAAAHIVDDFPRVERDERLAQRRHRARGEGQQQDVSVRRRQAHQLPNRAALGVLRQVSGGRNMARRSAAARGACCRAPSHKQHTHSPSPHLPSCPAAAPARRRCPRPPPRPPTAPRPPPRAACALWPPS